jgi:hypothetical protein
MSAKRRITVAGHVLPLVALLCLPVAAQARTDEQIRPLVAHNGSSQWN